MRKDSELFLKKILEYRKKVGKDSFEVIYQDYKEIPSIETAIFDILEDLIKNNCLTSQSKVTDLEGHISINLTLDGITYFDGAKTTVDISNYFFNVSGGQVNFAKDNGTISAAQNNNKGNNDFQKNEIEFQNNKKQDYIKIWNSRLFLHTDNDERPITLADAFIMPDYKMEKSVNRIGFNTEDTLDKVIEKFAEYNKTSSILIKGAPGMGKSSITSWIANRYKEDDRCIVLRFRDWEVEELEEGLLKAIINTLKCKKKDLEFKILVLDGFDEIKSLDIRQNILETFFNYIKDLSNFKCIITSRPTYTNSNHFQNVIDLEEFDINKVATFYGIITQKELLKKEKIESDLNVLGIPVILYLAIMSKMDISEHLSKPELYNHIFAKEGGIFDRFYNGENEYGEGTHILRSSENIKKYLCFLQDVAFKMFEKNDLYLQKGEYYVPELEFQRRIVNILEFPIKHLFEYTESNIEFIHKSIYEYFVSEYIFSLMAEAINSSNEELAGIFGYLLKKNTLSKEILEFMRFKIRNSKLKDMLKTVYEVFRLMLQDGMTFNTEERFKNVIECEKHIFVNMLEIMHLWDCKGLMIEQTIINYIGVNAGQYPLNLKDFKLHSMRVYEEAHTAVGGGIDLYGYNLSNADLSGTDLSGSNLSEVNLTGANLAGAKLIGAHLINTNLTNANLEGTDLRRTVWSLPDIKKAHTQLQAANFESLYIYDYGEFASNIIKEIYKYELETLS